MLPSARRVTALANATDPFSKPFLEQIQLGGEAPEPQSTLSGSVEERFGEGIGRVGQSGDPAGRRQHVADQLDALAGQFGGYARDAVTFPPGRGRLMIRPVPIGSPVSAITIGFPASLGLPPQRWA